MSRIPENRNPADIFKPGDKRHRVVLACVALLAMCSAGLMVTRTAAQRRGPPPGWPFSEFPTFDDAAVYVVHDVRIQRADMDFTQQGFPRRVGWVTATVDSTIRGEARSSVDFLVRNFWYINEEGRLAYGTTSGDHTWLFPGDRALVILTRGMQVARAAPRDTVVLPWCDYARFLVADKGGMLTVKKSGGIRGLLPDSLLIREKGAYSMVERSLEDDGRDLSTLIAEIRAFYAPHDPR